MSCPLTSQQCLPTCVNYDPSTGQSTVLSCDCKRAADCRVVFSGPGGGGNGDEGGGPRGGGNPCVVPDNGGGTVPLPPVGCPYLSPDEFHMIVAGLPAGTTIVLGVSHQEFFCRGGAPGQNVCSFPVPIPNVDCDQNGGSLGGQQECTDSTLLMNMNGTGGLAGFNGPSLCP
ncbi:MAG: hypothetical protein IPK83_11440 [Planctomycetes bacterium]|nr:hypothetical protein [Planctomycetota bacterium]